MSGEAEYIKDIQGVNGPEKFFREVLGVTSLEDYQIKKILEPVAKYERVSIKATHSVGKTWTMARVALWFGTVYKNSKVITTAPTGRQVKKLLWGELHSAYQGSLYPLGGKLLTTEWQIGPEWYVMGFSPQKEAASNTKEQSGSSFQGFHADYILIIFDEATGIPADIWKMAEGLMTSGKIVKFVAIANPTTRSCEFFKTFQDDSWFNVGLTCFDSPNLIANGITSKHKLSRELNRLKELDKEQRLEALSSYEQPVPHLLSCKWVMSKALKWGLDHPLFQSKALGEFPDVDEDVIVQLADVEEAMTRDREYPKQALRCIGVDVARYGKDDSVITTLANNVQIGFKALSQRSTTQVAGKVIDIVEHDKSHFGATRVLVDATGVGAGVFDILNEHYRKDRNVEVIEIHFGQSPVLDTDDSKYKDDQGLTEVDRVKSRYLNLKSRMFDILASDLKADLALMNEDIYLEELPTIQYEFTIQGKMKVEGKDSYGARMSGKSPDASDSLALANLGRHRKSVRGTFFATTQERTINKQEKTSNTIDRIAKRIKLNNY